MKLTLYLLRNLIGGTVFVSVCLLWILWLSQAIHFIELVVQKGLRFSTFLLITLLLLPNFMIIILPISLFISTLFVYYRLNNDCELIVLKAAGISNIQIGTPALLCSIAIMIVCHILTVYGVPSSVEQFHKIKSVIKNSSSHLPGTLLRAGTFVVASDNIVIYAHSIKNREFLGLFIHDTRSPQHVITTLSEHGTLSFSTEGKTHILMANGNQQEVKKTNLEILHFEKYILNINQPNTTEKRRFRDARERKLLELLRAIENTEGLSTTDVRRFKIEAHQRLILPFLNPNFVAIALSILLTSPLSKSAQNTSLLLAIGISTSIEIAVLSIVNSSSWQVNAVSFLYCVVFIPLFSALYYLYASPLVCKRKIL